MSINGSINLVVTKAELDHYQSGHELEAQIALRSPSPEIGKILRGLTAKNRVRLVLGGCIILVVGDSGAIWRAHNGEFINDFDSLFFMLFRRPNEEMMFLCEIE